MILRNNFLLLPSDRIYIEDMFEASGRSIEDAQKTIAATGISSVHYVRQPKLSNFIFQGLSSIEDVVGNVFDGIDSIIVVSQTFDERIPSISTRIQKKLSLPEDTFCVDIVDGCCGFIKAISLASMLEAQGKKKILVVAGDLNSLITKNSDLGTKALFGDGVAVSFLESDINKVDIVLNNSGDESSVISCSASENLMQMNGFEVFRFTRNVVPGLVEKFLRRSNKCLDSFDLIALHQASKLVVSSLSSMLKIKNKFSDDFNCAEFGNLGAGSIGAWLARVGSLESKGELQMLALGFGAGLSWGLASVVVNIKRNEVVYVPN